MHEPCFRKDTARCMFKGKAYETMRKMQFEELRRSNSEGPVFASLYARLLQSSLKLRRDKTPWQAKLKVRRAVARGYA